MISIVVCTKNRRPALGRCIESIIDLCDDGHEVVVVDNSVAPDPEMVACWGGQVRYVWEARPGSGFARGAGVRCSQGEFIAMTDDDCVVDQDWIRWLTLGFRDEGVMCCTGHVAALELETPAQMILETHCSYSKGRAPKVFGGPAGAYACLIPQEVGTGANMAFRRSAFDRVGTFDGALGAGTPAAGGEELDIFSRILRAGGKIAYEPRAVVRHAHPRDYGQLRHTFFNYGTGYNAFMLKLILTTREMSAFKAAYGRTLFWYRWTKRSLRCRLRGMPHMPLDLQAAYLLGSIYGPIGYARSVERARRLVAGGYGMGEDTRWWSAQNGGDAPPHPGRTETSAPTVGSRIVAGCTLLAGRPDTTSSSIMPWHASRTAPNGKARGGIIRRMRGSLRGQFLEIYSRISSSLPGGFALPPLQVIFELTHRCNLSCTMCFIYREIHQKQAPWTRNELTQEEITAAIKQFPRTTRFTFTGGEPFARRDIMGVLKAARESHRCGVGTNGTLLDETRCREIVDLGIDFVQVSLDGPEEVHDLVRGSRGAFRRTVQAIERIQELKVSRKLRRPWLYVNCTITSANVHTLDRVVEIADQLGVEYVTLQVVSSAVDNSGVLVDDELEEKINARLKLEALDVGELARQVSRIEQLKGRVGPKVSFQGRMSASEVLAYYEGTLDLAEERCIFPWVNAWISPYGQMFPCFGYAVGQLKESKSMAVWNSERFRKFRIRLREKGTFPGCLGCCHMRRHGGW
ncbi:MAG: radical SAM protein [Chloroflexi bacterium]|nr:radical SAM protein [Chloroflexota bacterium]